LGALRRFLVARQHELFEDVSAVATGVFKDRHGKPISLLRFDVTAFLLRFPRRGGKTPRSGKARDSGNARQDQEPDHKEENENQEVCHSQIIRFSGFHAQLSQEDHHGAPIRERRLNEVQGHEAREQEPLGTQEIAQQQGPKNKRARNQSQPTIQIHVFASKE
jgi:hypothetical protein